MNDFIVAAHVAACEVKEYQGLAYGLNFFTRVLDEQTDLAEALRLSEALISLWILEEQLKIFFNLICHSGQISTQLMVNLQRLQQVLKLLRGYFKLPT